MAETKTDTPTLKADITIDGINLVVHQDCREVRERFERWLRQQALGMLDKMKAEKEISDEEYHMRRAETFAELKRMAYAYGSLAYVTAQGTHAGIVQSFVIRIGLVKENPAVTPAAIEKWVETVGWNVANQVLALADGFCPKSNTPVDGQS